MMLKLLAVFDLAQLFKYQGEKMKDIIIIGGGPAGLSAALYAKRAGLSVVVLDKGAAESQLTKATDVDNYLGIPNCTGEELYKKFMDHIKDSGIEIIRGSVNAIETNDDHISVYTKKEEFACKNAIIATGRTHRSLGIDGEEAFSGSGVSYCATCDGYFFKDKTVCVIGGGDSALSEAVYLSELCKKVYIMHRRDTFRAAKYLVERAEERENIKFLFNAVPVRIVGEGSVKALKYKVLDEEKELKCEGIFVSIGEIPNMQFNVEGLETDNNGYIITDNYCRTNFKNISAVGDIRKKELYQIITAVADGAVAIEGILKSGEQK